MLTGEKISEKRIPYFIVQWVEWGMGGRARSWY